MKFWTVLVLMALAFTAGATEARWHWIVTGAGKLWRKAFPPKP
jgi:hypothetical protein